MAKTLTKEETERRGQLDIPSQTKERDPGIARTIGLVGACFGLFGIGMWLINNARSAEAIAEKPYYFKPIFIYLWWLVGVVGLLFHASQDRDLLFRRLYGLLGFILVIFGSLVTIAAGMTIWFGASMDPSTAFWLSALIALAGGAILLMCMVCPFVQEGEGEGDTTNGSGKALLARLQGYFPDLLKGLTTNPMVQQIAMGGGMFVVAFSIAGYFLLDKFGASSLLPYGSYALAVGLVFVLLYAAKETETNWQQAGIYLAGAIGVLAALAGLTCSLVDSLAAQNSVLPYALSFGLIGCFYLWAFTGGRDSGTDVGFYAPFVLMAIGLLHFLPAAIRSIFSTFLVPDGVLLMTLGGGYLLLGFLLSDYRVAVMTRRELAALFFSPIAYFVLAGMTAIAWISFILFLNFLAPTSELAPAQPIPEPIVRFYFGGLPVICLIFFVPALTMRLLSEERRLGTYEVLMTAPVGETSVALSKFLACWLMYLLTWLPWLAFPLALRIIGKEDFDYRPILSFYLAIAVMGTGFVAMGLFFSSLTQNQIVAFMLIVVAMMVLTLFEFLREFILSMVRAAKPPWPEENVNILDQVLSYLSYYHQLNQFMRGKVELKYLILHLSAAVFCIFLTVKVLEARKWK